MKRIRVEKMGITYSHPRHSKNDNFAGVSCDDKWNKYYEDIHAYIGNGEDPLKI